MVCLTGRFSAVNLLVVYVLSGFCSGVKQELCASWQIQAKGEVEEAVSTPGQLQLEWIKRLPPDQVTKKKTFPFLQRLSAM